MCECKCGSCVTLDVTKPVKIQDDYMRCLVDEGGLSVSFDDDASDWLTENPTFMVTVGTSLKGDYIATMPTGQEIGFSDFELEQA